MSFRPDRGLPNHERLEALRGTGLLDAVLPAPEFERLARLAARLLRAPVSIVALVDADRQVILGAFGQSQARAAPQGSPLPHSVCQYVVTAGAPLVVPDARADPGLRDHPGLAELGAVAYLGVPLVNAAGHALGALCVTDSVPRAWSSDDVEALGDLAAQTVREIELRTEVVERGRLLIALERERGRNRELLALAPAFICVLRGRDHVFEFANGRYCQLVGHSDLIGKPVREAIPEVAAQGLVALLDRVLATGEAHSAERMSVRLERTAGAAPEERVVNFVYHPTVEPDGARSGVFVLGVDVTDEVRAHEQLVRHDALLAETQQMACIGSWELDIAADVVTWSAEMFRLHGVAVGSLPYTMDEYIAHVHPDDRPGIRAAIEHARTTGTPLTGDYRIVRPDGTVRSLHGHGRVERDASGRALRLLGSCQDVTDRVQTLASLRQSEERYRLSSAATRDFIYDADVRIGTVSRTGCSEMMLGYSATDLAPTIDAWGALVHPDDRERVEATIRAALSPGTTSYSSEYRMRRRDGSYATVQDRGTVVRDATGTAHRMVGAVADLTEQRAAEEALRASESRFRLALSVAGMFAWEHDLLTDRLRLDPIPAAGAAVPFGADELRDYAHFLEMVHPEDRENLVRVNADAVARRGEFSIEYRIVGAHGAVRWSQTVGRVIAGQDGRPERMVGVSLDVTDRRALEAQLRQAQRMEAVGRLAGGVAHDFNNLLTVISASTMFARDEVPAHSPAAFELDQIDEASRRAADLTRQLLAFSRKQVLRPQRVDVNQRVAGLELLLRRVIGEDARIEMRLETPVWPVSADPGQLEQVLMNLVINARDAMSSGGTVQITTSNVIVDAATARAYPGLSRGQYVSLAVADTGTGIPADLLPHIFEPFVTTKGPGKGTGLGLPMVYGIVKQSGGYVDVQSTLGQGTTFTVLLPRDDDDDAPVGIAPAKMPSPGGRETVLLVEDEAAVRTSLARVLTRNGYRVIEAADGEEALRAWHAIQGGGPHSPGVPASAATATGQIDLVLTDLVMPILGGRLLVERLRAEQPDIRIIIMTGYTADTAGVQALLAGDERSAFLQKPIRPDELLRAVRQALEARLDRP